MAHLFCDLRLQSIVKGIAVPINGASRTSQVRVQSGSTARWRGEEKSLGRLHGENTINIVRPAQHVEAMISYITHCHCDVRGKFMLHVQIPDHDVIARRVELNIPILK